MFKIIKVVAAFFLIFPSISFAAYGAKNLDLKLFCISLGAESKSDMEQTGLFPISLVFKGKRAHETKVVLDEKCPDSETRRSYGYTVYVDKIALKQKGSHRLSLDKDTLILKGNDDSFEMKCKSKSESELKEEFNKVLS